MKILVTGAAGFIGSNFVYYELEKHPKDKIVALDLLTYAGNLSNLEGCKNNPNFSFVKTDICDRENINKLFEKEKFEDLLDASPFGAMTICDRAPEASRDLRDARVARLAVRRAPAAVR